MLGLIRNLFAVIGLVLLAGTGYLYSQYQALGSQFDPEAPRMYGELVSLLLASKNSAEATVWKVPVAEGIAPEDVEEAMKMVANEQNIANVGILPLYQDITAKTGKPYRFAKIYMFCNSLTAAKMMDYSEAFSAYLPCRITLLEDAHHPGRYSLLSLNMDLMIYGGAPLPPDLKAEALKVKETILTIMRRGAKGEF